MRQGLAAIALTALAVSSQRPQAPPETYDAFAQAFATGDANRVGALYDEDAAYLPPAGDMLRGRAAIRDRFAESFRSARDRHHTRTISFELVRRVSDGAVRSDVGYYTITARGDGKAESFRGKFAKTWRRGPDGTWRIQVDAFSQAPGP